MTAQATISPADALAAYQRVRHRLPGAGSGSSWVQAEFSEVADGFDLILFDAYGVLNVGETAIPEAAARVAALRAAGKLVAVVSNSAGYSKDHMMARWRRLGFDFTPDEVITSRDALIWQLASEPPRAWGVMLNPEIDAGEIASFDPIYLQDDPADYDRAEGFLLIGADGWTDARQSLLEAALQRKPRPVLVGNPDLVAPREGGLTREPGWFAHRLSDATGVTPRFLGKPFPEIFDLAVQRRAPGIDPGRVLMVGDTLHTDILGGAQAGFATALVIGHGALVGLDITKSIAVAAIAPDFVVDHI